MSKTYFGRCAAVGIAGLTAMSSLAIVASAATQTSMLYELKYSGIDTISLKGDTKYGNGNTYCNPTAPGDLLIGAGFNTKLDTLLELEVENAYKDAAGISYDLNAGEIWSAAFFTKANIKSFATDAWKYQAYGEIASAGSSAVKLKDPYATRGTSTALTFTFMNETDRSAAKSAMIAKIKSDYSTLATKANAQFRADIEAAKKVALDDAAAKKQNAIDTANDIYNNSAKTTADAKLKNDAITFANNKYNAINKALSASASKIISEFNATFNAANFVYDYKTGDADQDTFGEAKCPVVYGSTIGGISGSATASYASVLGTTIDLTTAMYNVGATVYNTASDYVFAGEIQKYTDITSSQLVGNGNWRNYQIVDNNANSGGNSGSSSSSSSDDEDEKDKTDYTTWYPESSSYRAPSEVSYLGKNGSWYTSASAATAYGGGYTGTSKSSNYSAVNTAANGKAIYFDSTTGNYSTTSTSYSYVVKEATTTNDDPYYTYFQNKNNTTVTTAPAGSPALSGSSKYAGWTNISAYITNRAKSGATYTVNMNEGTVVPAAVLAAAKAKNITLVFVNDNGSKVTVKPGKVSVTNDLNVAITYNVKDVKSSLVTKAKKVNSAVSSAQVRIGTEGSIGGTETVTVKFSTKRSGCTVKAYRLTSSGSLKLEAKGTIASTGRVNLSIKNGGSYLLVVC
ncbi:MAG: hypothetical protein ACI4YB_11380 [Oscillospiraceae bacterium]